MQAASCRDNKKTNRVTSTGRDGEISSAEDLNLKVAPELEQAPNPALERDEAEAALLPPAAHLIMVVCCEED